MCLNIPGKIIQADKNNFIIDYGSEKRKVSMSLVDVKPGDWVLVSNKIIVVKVPEEEAKRFLEIIK